MLIGLNGPIGSGKNTVANILQDNWGYKQFGFADLLKESAATLFDIDAKDWEEIKNDPSARITLKWERTDPEDSWKATWHNTRSVSGREFLKRYGTEAHRKLFWDDIWVDMLLDPPNAPVTIDEDYRDIAIYDARFDNELRAIRQHGGKNIQIRRPGHEFDPSHPSESPPDESLIDYVVQNDAGIFDLTLKINELVKSEKLLDRYQSGGSSSPSPSPSPQLALNF